MYKNVRRVHLWASVIVGLVITLICATGCILLFEPARGAGGERSEFFVNVMRLHRWLFDVPPVKGAMTGGKMVVAISTVCMIVALVTGVWLWWLRARGSRTALTRNLKFSFGSGLRQTILSLHSTGGIYVAIFLLIMALTGLTWSFGWYRAGFNALFGIEKGSHVVYAIHTGAFGGIVTKVLWFAAAVTGVTLPLTGYYLLLSRKRRKTS